MNTPEEAQEFLYRFEEERNGEGWDVLPSLWMILADGTYTKLMDIPDGVEPETAVRALAKNGTSIDITKVKALVVSMEGWIHPERIHRLLDEMDDPEQALKMFRSLPDPSSFHDRQEVRTVVMVDYFGNVYSAGRKRDDDLQRFHPHSRTHRSILADGMKWVMHVHPQQNVRRVVESCLAEVVALLKKAVEGDPSETDEEQLDELVERILTAYKIHMPEEYPRQVALLQKISQGRLPRNP